MGRKNNLLKIMDIIRLPGNPRYIATLNSKGEETFELMCTVINGEKVNFRLPERFVDFMSRRIDSAYFRNFDPDFSDGFRYKEASDSIAANLAKCLLKLQNNILEIYNQEFTSGFYYEDTRLYHYMLSDRYELSEGSEHKYGFLPVDEIECIDSDCLAAVHKFLLEHPLCLPLFLYTITSLSESACDYSYMHEAKFSAWVYSSDYKNARTAANLLGNMFVYSPQSIYNAHKFHFNLTEKNGYDLDEHVDSFADLPLLVFSTSASHKLSTKKTKPIIDKTYRGNIRFYPVFISPTSTHSYKVLPLKIEDIHLKRSNFESLKGYINRVYRAFIYEMCRRNSFESVHTVVNDSFYKSLREILQSPLAYPLFHHHCVGLNCKEKNTPRKFIEINNELSSIRKDIIRYIPEALDIELDISSGFQDFQYDAKKKHGENHIIYMPTLTSDSKIPYEPVDDSLYDAENFLNELFIVYCKQVISELNKLRKAVCRCAFVFKLRYALEYFNSFMSKVGVDFQFRKQFMTEAYSALDKLLHKQPLLNTVSKEEQALIDKDISRFLKALNQTIYKNLNSDMVRNISFRISRDKSCKAYEVDSRVFRKLADAKVDTPFRQFLNELAKRDILIKNSGNPKQPRFVFQKTVNSHARNYYVVRADAIQIETYELTK